MLPVVVAAEFGPAGSRILVLLLVPLVGMPVLGLDADLAADLVVAVDLHVLVTVFSHIEFVILKS